MGVRRIVAIVVFLALLGALVKVVSSQKRESPDLGPAPTSSSAPGTPQGPTPVPAPAPATGTEAGDTGGTATPASHTDTIIGVVRGAEASATSRVAAKILLIDANVGKHVRQGDVLIILDDKDIRAQAQQARDNAAAAAATLSKAETGRQLKAQEIRADVAKAARGVDAARVDLEKAETGAAAGAKTGAAEIAKARAGLQAAQAQLAAAQRGARPEDRRQAEIQLEAAKKGLAQARDARDKLKFLAANGAVPKVKADQAEAQYNTALAQEQAAQETVKKINAGPTKEDLDALQAQVATAGAGLQEATSGAQARNEANNQNVASAKIGLQNAQQNLQMAQGAHRQLALSDAEVRAAEAQRNNANTSARLAEEQVGYTRITAPISGVVTAVNANIGDYASPGRPLVTIAGTSGLYIDASVPTRLLNEFRAGTPVNVLFDAYPNHTFRGIVREVSTAANPDGRSYPAKIDMNSRPTAGLRPGERARITRAQ